ncbi:WD40/YVTN/BNR-like repeat-containing protein [Thalassotalea piscium]
MLKFLFLVIAIIFSQDLSSQPLSSEAIISPLAQKSLLLDIKNVDDQYLIAVGERGHILRSTDGETWQQMPSPTQTTLTSVDFVNASQGWAVGHNATILHSADAGLTWQIQYQNPQFEIPFLNVYFKDENTGVAVGSYGLFFRTNDGGKNWQQEFHLSLLIEEDLEYLDELKRDDEAAYLTERSRILPHFNRFYQDGRTSYLVGELGLIAKSNDLGEHWERLEDIYQGSFYDINRTKKGNLLAVGLRGHVFRSVSNGDGWQNVIVETTALLNNIVPYQDQVIFILGNNGVLLKSVDDGLSFTLDNQSDGKALLAGAIFKDKLIVASEVGIKVIQVTP